MHLSQGVHRLLHLQSSKNSLGNAGKTRRAKISINFRAPVVAKRAVWTQTCFQSLVGLQAEEMCFQINRLLCRRFVHTWISLSAWYAQAWCKKWTTAHLMEMQEWHFLLVHGYQSHSAPLTIATSGQASSLIWLCSTLRVGVPYAWSIKVLTYLVRWRHYNILQNSLKSFCYCVTVIRATATRSCPFALAKLDTGWRIWPICSWDAWQKTMVAYYLMYCIYAFDSPPHSGTSGHFNGLTDATNLALFLTLRKYATTSTSGPCQSLKINQFHFSEKRTKYRYHQMKRYAM